MVLHVEPQVNATQQCYCNVYQDHVHAIQTTIGELKFALLDILNIKEYCFRSAGSQICTSINLYNGGSCSNNAQCNAAKNISCINNICTCYGTLYWVYFYF